MEDERRGLGQYSDPHFTFARCCAVSCTAPSEPGLLNPPRSLAIYPVICWEAVNDILVQSICVLGALIQFGPVLGKGRQVIFAMESTLKPCNALQSMTPFTLASGSLQMRTATHPRASMYVWHWSSLEMTLNSSATCAIVMLGKVPSWQAVARPTSCSGAHCGALSGLTVPMAAASERHSSAPALQCRRQYVAC